MDAATESAPAPVPDPENEVKISEPTPSDEKVCKNLSKGEKSEKDGSESEGDKGKHNINIFV